jgi:PTS system fructose-specific IIA component
MGFVSANQVTIGYTAASREDALHYLSDQAVELGFADDASAVEAAFIARENEAETGLVAGFAVPHAKSDAIHTPGVAVLKLTEPVEWPSFDGVPVDVALALYVPAGEAGTTHLRLLSKASVTRCARAPIPLRLRSSSIADSKTRTVIPFNQLILLQGKGPRRRMGVTALFAFPQIKPAKINLFLFGRLIGDYFTAT